MSKSVIVNIENLANSFDKQRLKTALEKITGYLPAQETHLEYLEPDTLVYKAVQSTIDRAQKAEDNAYRLLQKFHGGVIESR